jgi:hypothetical protein
MSLKNSGDPVNLAAYTLSSDAGGLNAGNWKSIAANYDVDGPNTTDGGALIGTVDPNNAWSELGTPNDLELTEAELLDQGAPIATGQTIDLGTGAWRRSPFEDVTVEVLLSGGEIAAAAVEYVGNNDSPFLIGDLDLDGDVDEDDFKNEFLPNYFADTSALSTVGRYFSGDLDNDGETGFQDFLLLKAAHQAANPGAASLSFSSVPEPHTWCLAVAALLMACAINLRNRGRRLAIASFAGIAVVVLMGEPVSAQFLINGDFEDTTGWQFAGTDPGTQPPGWRDTSGRNPATQQFDAAAIGGSGVSAFMQAFGTGTYSIQQNLGSPTSPVFDIYFEFASSDPGDSAMRSLSGSVLNENAGPMITFRVVDENDDGVGDLQFFSGTWQSGVLPNSVVFSAASSSPLAHTLSLHVDTAALMPEYDALLVDSNGVEHQVNGLSLFNNAPGSYTGTGGLSFNTNLSDGDYLLDNIAISNGVSDNALSLLVSKATGQVFLTNATGQSVSFDAYRIKSGMGSLSTGEWSSLQDQGLDGTPGNPAWTELGANASQIAEGNFNSQSMLADGQSISLGNIYNTLTDAEDLIFEFHVADAAPVSILGGIEYKVGLFGDYNGDNAVDAADYVVWRKTLGSSVANPFDGADGNGNSMIDAGDYGLWRRSFGSELASSAHVASTSAPEPSTLVASMVASVLAYFLRRSKENVLLPG